MKKVLLVVISFALLFAGCRSTPEVKRDKLVESSDGMTKYDVVIDKDYLEDPVEFQYAVNQFVKDRGGKSYDCVKIGSNDFLITIPGQTLVIDDLPEPSHFHVGRTIAAIAIPTGAGLAFLLFIAALSAAN